MASRSVGSERLIVAFGQHKRLFGQPEERAQNNDALEERERRSSGVCKCSIQDFSSKYTDLSIRRICTTAAIAAAPKTFMASEAILVKVLDPMKLSIAIPIYNFADFIPETLNSIVTQEHGDTVEIVVTDGASTDRTAEVMAEFCSKYPNIIYNRLPEKGGIDRDIAKAVEATHGQYVWLFSGDDIMHPGSLATVLDQIASEDDIYLCKHMECTAWMQPLYEYPVLDPDGPEVFELSDQFQRMTYFKRAVNSEAFFSFCSGLIIRRSTWDRVPLDPNFIGSCWAHSARFFSLMTKGLKVNYLGRALLSRRGDNDSFSGKGFVDRYRIQVDGFHDLADTFFGRHSPEAREIRRAIRSEFHPHVSLILKYLCHARPEVESKSVLDRIVARAYQDPSLECLKVRLTYALMPSWVFRRKHKWECYAHEHLEEHKAEEARKRAEYLSTHGSPMGCGRPP